MKESMAVTESLVLQFVIPVAAVVLCAFLVFMFGFKHAPEPTFEFEYTEDRKGKKNKGKKKPEKDRPTQSNGHVVNIEPPKVGLPQMKQSASEKKEPTTKKQKKLSKVNKTESIVETAQEEDDGGWTTAVSKKEKKKKRFDQDDNVLSHREDVATSNSEADEEPMLALQTEVIQPIVAPLEPETSAPLEQRSSKRSKKGKSNNIKDTVAPKVNNDALTKKENKAAVVSTEDLVTVAKIDEPFNESLKEQQGEVTAAEEIYVAPEIVEEKEQTPSKKSKKKKKKGESDLLLQKDVSTENKSIIGDHSKNAENSIETQIAEAMCESPTLTLTEDKTAKPENKSPKKNKKKQKGGGINKEELSQPGSSQSTTSQSTDTSHTSTISNNTSARKVKQQPEEAPPAIHLKVSSGDKATEKTTNNGATAVSASKSAAAVPKANSGDSEVAASISFDELGEWQEAKPVKKRKKPRRDN